ncbi:hypothetical protein CRM22_000782 [Opisthorchis felineus]|uniref:Uncharacterized protein n=1 Tax=Opisthorchis felineus TaxID=147828 RepID=A0A4S2MHY9_OPIFE|nr:hypothetical protein CRM22_000782 [Opisthorchis felineus]
MTYVPSDTFRPQSSPPFQTRRNRVFRSIGLPLLHSDPIVFNSLKPCSSTSSITLAGVTMKNDGKESHLKSKKRISLKRLADTDNPGPQTRRKTPCQKDRRRPETVYLDPDGAVGEEVFVKPSPLERLMRTCDRLSRQHRQSPFSRILQRTNTLSETCDNYTANTPIKNPLFVGLLSGVTPLDAFARGPLGYRSFGSPHDFFVQGYKQLHHHPLQSANAHYSSQDLFSALLGFETARFLASMPRETRSLMISSQLEHGEGDCDASAHPQTPPTLGFSSACSSQHDPRSQPSSKPDNGDCDVCTQTQLLLATMHFWQTALNLTATDPANQFYFPPRVSSMLPFPDQQTGYYGEDLVGEYRIPLTAGNSASVAAGEQKALDRGENTAMYNYPDQANVHSDMQQRTSIHPLIGQYHRTHKRWQCGKLNRNPPEESQTSSTLMVEGSKVDSSDRASVDKRTLTSTQSLASRTSATSDPPMLWSNLVRLLTAPSLTFP